MLYLKYILFLTISLLLLVTVSTSKRLPEDTGRMKVRFQQRTSNDPDSMQYGSIPQGDEFETVITTRPPRRPAGDSRPRPPGGDLRPRPPGDDRPRPPGDDRPRPPGDDRPRPPGDDRPRPPPRPRPPADDDYTEPPDYVKDDDNKPRPPKHERPEAGTIAPKDEYYIYSENSTLIPGDDSIFAYYGSKCHAALYTKLKYDLEAILECTESDLSQQMYREYMEKLEDEVKAPVNKRIPIYRYLCVTPNARSLMSCIANRDDKPWGHCECMKVGRMARFAFTPEVFNTSLPESNKTNAQVCKVGKDGVCSQKTDCAGGLECSLYPKVEGVKTCGGTGPIPTDQKACRGSTITMSHILILLSTFFNLLVH